MHKAKVFLSSSQFEDEFKIERELLPVLFSKEPLSSVFDLWKIEDQAASISIESQYTRNVKKSDLMILLIDTIIRDAVINEFEEAKRNQIPIYIFIRSNNSRSLIADDFIVKVRTSFTTTNYGNIKELSEKIENSLLEYHSSKITTNETTIEEKRSSDVFDMNERALKIALYTLNKNAMKYSAEKIIPLIITINLVQKSMIRDELCEIIPIADKALIDRALNILNNNLEVINNAGLYSLSTHKKEELLKVIKKVDKEENAVKKEIAEKYAPSVSLSSDKFITLLCKIMSLVVYKTTMRVNDYFSSFNAESYDSEILKRIILDSVIVYSKDNASEWQKIIIDLLKSKEGLIVNWITNIHKSFWFLSSLGLDNNINNIFRENIEDYFVFLDSHIVLKGMLRTCDDAKTCHDILKIGKRLNVNMFVSLPILHEIKSAFYYANEFYESCGGDIERIKSLLEQLDKKHDIIDAFINMKVENPDIEWYEYIRQFYSSRDDRILITYLEKVFHLHVDEYDFSTEDWTQIIEYQDELLAKRKRNMDKKISLSSNPEREESRQIFLRENEAKQLFLLYKYRKEKGPKYWFVTFDKYIYKVCVGVYEQNKNNSYYYPCYIKPMKWLEILSISDREDIDNNVFSDILASAPIHYAVNSVEANVITSILSRNIDTKISEKSVLKNMFKETVDNILDSNILNDGIDEQIDDKTIESLKNVLYEKLEKYDSVFKSQDSEMKKIIKERDKAQAKAKYYKAELTKRTRRKK